VGALSALAELLLLREVLFLAGGTELAAAVLLATWLVAGAAGAFAAARRRNCATISEFAKRTQSAESACLAASLAARNSHHRLNAPGVLLGACALIFPVQILALRLVRGVLAGPSGELPSVFSLLFLGAAVSSPLPAVLGAIFPISAARLGRSGAARAYAIETAGIGTGAGLTLALAYAGQEHIAVALLAALFALCGGLLWRRRMWLAGLALALLLLAAAGPWEALERASISFAFRTPGVDSFASTPHGRAFSTLSGGHDSESRPPAHIHAGGFSETPLAAANEAVELVIAAARSRKRVLVVCTDPEGYARTLSTFPGTQSTVLAPDPGMLEFRRKVRPFPSGENVTVAAQEPLQYLRAGGPLHDVVLVSAGAPLSAGNNRLFTLSFYRLVRSRLVRGGFLAVEMPYSPGHVSSGLGALVGSVWATLGEVFENRRIALTQHAGSLLLLASDEKELGRRAPGPLPGRDEARRRLGLYAPVDFEGAFSSSRTQLSRAMLDGRTWPHNTVTNPACYRLALVYSQRRFGPPGVLEWFWRLKFYHWLGAACAVGGVFFLLALVRRGGWGPSGAAMGGGFCAMVVQVTVIYVFQSAHGLLYSHMGLLSGAFMAGALCGALYCRKYHSPGLAFGLLGALALYCGALPFLLGAFAPSSHFAARYLAFPAASALAGILTGALFPACSNLVPERSAGRIYAADLAGASAGALLAGLVLVPSLGLYSTAFTACCAGLLLALPMLPAIIGRRSRIFQSPGL
jgi:spermidine synthase